MSNPYYRTTRDGGHAGQSGSRDDAASKRFDPHHHGSFPRSGSGSVGQERSGAYDGPSGSAGMRPQVEYQQEPYNQYARSDVATYEPATGKAPRVAAGPFQVTAYNGPTGHGTHAVQPSADYAFSDPYAGAQQHYGYPSPNVPIMQHHTGPSAAPARQNTGPQAYYTDPYAETSPESSIVYPPQPGGANGSDRLGVPAGDAPRPDTPGLHPDKPLNRSKLTPAQVRIADQFPKDLDKEGGSMWEDVKQMARDWRTYVRWRYLHWYVLLVLLIVGVALLTIYHRQIVDWLTPISKKVKSVSWGWVIVVAILFVISFPPLFGHEIIGVLCGVVYGLWLGFGILSLGTLLGEIGNFYAFKLCLKRTAEKYERKSINYACMAHITREGGFLVILLARLSALPGHISTAVFATIGMNFFVFTAAAILSLPKQLAVVYVGVAITSSSTGEESPKAKAIKWVVLIISAIVTIGAALYLHKKMDEARPEVQRRLRARRYTMLSEARMTEAWEAEGRDDAASPAGSTAKLYGDGAAGVYSRDDLHQPPFDVEDGRRKPSSAAWSRWANKGSNQSGEEAGPLRDRGVSAEGDAGAIGLSVLNHRDQPPQPDQRLGMARSYSQGSSEDVHEQKALTEGVPASYGRAGPPPTSYNQDYVNDRADAHNGFQPKVQGHRLAPGGHHGQERYQHHSGVGSIYSLPPGSEDNRYGNAAGAGSAAARRNPSVKVQLQDRQNAAMTAVADALYADRTVASPATYRTQPFPENQRVQGHAGTGSQSYPLQQDAARTMSPRPPSYQTEANGERGQPSNDSRYSYRGQAM
ncbi:hypothetical protein IE81DRAFT_296915 [Ceraceosorus guamensis]|uniref:Golgi apparatus membrane protein TVP38 n=1 Tax=Ceraceosorus guamensis TaxID=1522189 RepID=A0A316W7J8_9BASI|nr:hypothetical protein IE81DRAFT_296915 [Ceraceosorus guamensis]PWN45890.1 hypothetical protein IE81DRAFT_296915 [Ceraceosorus guamensis]